MVKKQLSEHSSISDRSFRYSKRERGIQNTFTHNEIVNLTDEKTKKDKKDKKDKKIKKIKKIKKTKKDSELEQIKLEVIEFLAQELVKNGVRLKIIKLSI